MNNAKPVIKIDSPQTAIKAAIEQFPSQAAFWRALQAQAKAETPITKAAVSQWLRRGKGAPANLCPDIEVISGVACELLRPDVSWAELRKTSRPPVYVPRNLGAIQQAP